ncbi:hypothetical protein [Parvibaculum sp.]|uniref:hypothetical protein n=1 Tax=Parvibaculum sp. TaxID=2024848 RepID=UPI002BDD4A01|nr:hypothetical protein [Parvibaculum sp.]HUD52149.1 hypothetical protein [Parvibaculum sp.]
MVVPSRWSDIHVQGGPGYRLGEGPFWQGTESREGGWWHPKAILAADFLGARYAVTGVGTSLDATFSTARSSPHFLADAAGVFQGFGPNALATLSGVGAFIGGQATSLLANGNDLSLASWSNSTSATATSLGTTALGIFKPTAISTAAASAQSRRTQSAVGGAVNGRPIAVQIYYRAGTSGRIHIRNCPVNSGPFSNITGPAANPFETVTETAGTITQRSMALLPDGVTCLARYVFTPNYTGNYAFQIGASTAVNGETLIVLGVDAVAGVFWPPFHATSSPAPTRLASDVRAASLGWFDAVGLAAGATELLVPNWSQTGLGVERPLFEFSDGTANNLIGGYVDAADKPTLRIVAGGVTQVATALPVAISSGRKPLAFGWSEAGGYVADRAGNVASFGAAVLPAGLNIKRVGGGLAGTYLNATLEQLQTCRPLTQDESRTWVTAA